MHLNEKIGQLSPSPPLHPIPESANRRLIDEGLLHYEASLAGFAERYGRGETSHTIHVWWARRPHTAMRALVFASLCKTLTKQASEIMSRIGLSTSISDRSIEEARALISSQYDEPPVLLDMFGGGGTIPFEALNLGADTHAIDANELSVFIQKCNLVYSQKINSNKNIQQLIEECGTRVLIQLARETTPLYPRREFKAMEDARPVFGYLWTYSIICEKCKYRFFILKRPWLSKKKGKRLAFVISNKKNGQLLTYKTVENDYKYPSVWSGKNGIVKCPKCQSVIDNVDTNRCNDEMVAMIRHAHGSGKEFIPVGQSAIPSQDLISEIEQRTLSELNAELPTSTLPVWSGIVNPALYGVRTHSDFLNPRQRTVLLSQIFMRLINPKILQ